jgi:hypothetical protein
MRSVRSLALPVVLCAVSVAHAGVLPEDRADVLFHSYSGDGVTIQGPSVLVRKQFAGKFSASANYYVDEISSASVDVVTIASPYVEKRTQYSVGLDYLHDRWLMNIGFTQSEENDFSAETVSIGVSQDFFGDLTTPEPWIFSMRRCRIAPRRRELQRASATSTLPARALADPHAEFADGAFVRVDYR